MARERWFHFSGGKIVLGSAQPTTHMVVESLGEKITDALPMLTIGAADESGTLKKDERALRARKSELVFA